MANRELLIAFVYDTQRCTQEADDPQDAVLFFHPGWVSEQQRLALCGQLMGATYFLLATFSSPRILSLQSGKFAIRTFGRYVVAVGTDRNIPEWVLEQRAETMASLLHLYFGDLENLASQCEIKNKSEQSPTFSERLGRIFETFLPIIQYAGQILGNVPTVRLPKSASKVFLEAMQILHSCQEKQGVLGGTILYQNKVVASQLSAEVTKQLVLSDPYRIKSPGTNIKTTFRLPLGAQLLQIYVTRREFHSLKRDAEQVRNTFTEVDKAPKVSSRGSRDSFPGMKGEKSRIFTVFEEDDNELEVPLDPPERSSTIESCIPEVDCESLLDSSPLEEPQPSVDKGSRFVCGTPMRDLNVSKVLHAQAVSICSRTDNRTSAKSEKRTVADVADNNEVCNMTTVIPDVVRDAVAVTARSNKRDALGSSQEILPSGKIFQAMQDLRAFLKDHSPNRSLSISLPSINTNNIPMRYYSLGLPVPTDEQCSPQHSRHYFYNTITDPCFPVFRHDGLPLSRCLFDQRIAHHYQQLHNKPVVTGDVKSKQTPISLEKNAKTSVKEIPLLPVGSQAASGITPPLVEGRIQASKRPVSLQLKMPSLTEKPSDENALESSKSSARPSRPTSLAGIGSSRPTSTSDPATSRPTSLPGPLKDPVIPDDRKRQAQQSLPSVARPTSLSGGLPLTPLMAKLSHLAMDRHGTLGTPLDVTPCDPRDPVLPNRVETPMVPFAKPLPRLSQSDIEEFTGEGNEEAALLVCGVQSMTLLLLLEPGHTSSTELFTSLWEVAASSLEGLETALNHSLDQIPSSSTNAAESYSFLCIDPAWDAVHKGGAWSGPELELVGSLHRDFKENRSLTEICVRVHDNLVYGYQCGQTEVFYQQQQPGQVNVGLPTPADLMGTVPLKARRRLERDHGIVLL